jgi:NAD(P)-dependent dehydrogenase (short-subunit alcohol dehydrogenase family)
MVMAKFDLTGKVVVITGAARGLGREMTLALAKAGAHIVAGDVLSEQNEETAAAVRALGRRALALTIDVRDSSQCDALIQRCLDEFGRVDVMLSNAGIGEGRGLGKPLWELSDADWRDNIDINLSSAFYCARAVAKPMIEQGSGVIINLSSGTALRGTPPIFPYAAAKAGIISLTKSLAVMLARYNIRVNCIIPGEFARRPCADEQEEAHWRDRGRFFPAQRVGEPWELGPLAVFLASDASSYLTGQGFALDGGFLAGGYAPIPFAPEARTGGI